MWSNSTSAKPYEIWVRLDDGNAAVVNLSSSATNLATQSSVQADADGVPYSALLYQGYVGGVWRQVQDAYSKVKGDTVLECPLRDFVDEHNIPYHHTRPRASSPRHR